MYLRATSAAPLKWGLADDLGQFGLQQVPISLSMTPVSGVFGRYFWTHEVIFMFWTLEVIFLFGRLLWMVPLWTLIFGRVILDILVQEHLQIAILTRN